MPGIISFTLKTLWLFAPAALFFILAAWFNQPDPGAAYCRWHAEMTESNLQPNIHIFRVAKEMADNADKDPNNITAQILFRANANDAATVVGEGLNRIRADHELAQYLENKPRLLKRLCLVGGGLCAVTALLLTCIFKQSAVKQSLQ